MGDPESFDLETTALLDADSIPNENQSHTCFSCGEDMTGVFCYACGNKNDNYRRSIWSLGAELFSSLTALEGRTWRSFKSLLFRPGQMARDYADGARQKWTSPVRLYLATSLLLFGYIALSQTQLIAFAPKEDPNSVLEVDAGEAKFTPKIYFLERKSKIQRLTSNEAITAFEKGMGSILSNDSDKTVDELNRELEITRDNIADMNERIENPQNIYAKSGLVVARDAMQTRVDTLIAEIAKREEAAASAANIEVAPEDSSKPSLSETKAPEDTTEDETEAQESSGGSTLNITGMTGKKYSLDSEGMSKAISIALRQPERLNRPVNKYLSQIMFFMMPFSMLIGAIFIRGKEQAMLYDHLVHAAYIHAFSFLLLFVFILLTQLTPIKGLLWIYTLILLIYLPLSAKRMFARGWFKTLLASYGVGLIYAFNMFMILGILITMGLVDIAISVADVPTPTA